MNLLVTDGTPVNDEGTIIVLEGVADNGDTLRFGVDHRPAADILNLLDTHGEITVTVEPWQLLGRVG
jgi:hypothetical protein